MSKTKLAQLRASMIYLLSSLVISAGTVMFFDSQRELRALASMVNCETG